jgi:hypothetical protein
MKNELIRLTLVHCDDWEALYINEELAIQNSILTSEEVLRYLTKEFSTNIEFKEKTIDEEWIELQSEFPSSLKDVQCI